MKGSKDLLTSILKTAQLEQVGIRCVLKCPLRATLRSALKSQLEEFDSIEQEAYDIASHRGWDLNELDPAMIGLRTMKIRAHLTFSNSDSKVAEMVIQDNTKDMIKSLRNLHRYHHSDQRISILSQKLLDAESANIRQMQGFL